MSLEEALKANTAAIEKHTAAIEKMLAGAGAAAATKPAAGGKPAATASTAAAPDVAAVTKEVTTFLKAGATDHETDARADHVASIVKKFKAERFTKIDPAKFNDALKMLRAFTYEAPAEDGDEGGEEDDASSMV